MHDEHVLLQVTEGVACLTLNRPERKNAFLPATIDLLAETIERCASREDVRVIVLTGAGDAFCSGADIGAMNQRQERTALQRKNDLTNGVHRVLRAFAATDKPLIAAVNGVAVGAGLDFALMCDLIYMADTARVGETYVRMGLFPGAGSTWSLPRRIGYGKALELFWTGALIDAQEAERIGLADRVLPVAELMPFVHKRAAEIAANAPLSVRYMKRAVQQGQNKGLVESLDFISSQLAILASSLDHREATEAFVQKRRPIFKGE